MTRLAEIRALLEKATGGEWRDDGRGAVTSTAQTYIDPLNSADKRDREICKCSDGDGIFAVSPRDWSNAKLIAATVNALPALLEIAELALQHDDPQTGCPTFGIPQELRDKLTGTDGNKIV